MEIEKRRGRPKGSKNKYVYKKRAVRTHKILSSILNEMPSPNENAFNMTQSPNTTNNSPSQSDGFSQLSAQLNMLANALENHTTISLYKDALQMAYDLAFQINMFKNSGHYISKQEDYAIDMARLHVMADSNLKYILKNKQ